MSGESKKRATFIGGIYHERSFDLWLKMKVRDFTAETGKRCHYVLVDETDSTMTYVEEGDWIDDEE